MPMKVHTKRNRLSTHRARMENGSKRLHFIVQTFPSRPPPETNGTARPQGGGQ